MLKQVISIFKNTAPSSDAYRQRRYLAAVPAEKDCNHGMAEVTEDLSRSSPQKKMFDKEINT